MSTVQDDRAGQAAREESLVRLAARLTLTLGAPRPAVFWLDLSLSAGLGYLALALACSDVAVWIRLLAGGVSILALYRAESFIHELCHLKSGAVPGFALAWNLAIGIPLLTPSFLYDGVHNLHHARTRYGTAEDPEYLRLAAMSPWTLPVSVIMAGFAPVLLMVRFALLAPVSAIVPPLRRILVERFSALAINPAFRREPPRGPQRRRWLLLESAASAWAIAILAGAIAGLIPLRVVLTGAAVLSGMAVLNQVRTLAAHLWESDGEPLSVTGQYLDSVNVPPPGWLPALWAPVGLRYHALHHLLPGIPYHRLGEAHRRLTSALPPGAGFERADHPGLASALIRLVRAAGGSAA
ncbi:fatty acid desaturase [Sphingomonas ginsenosidivorax]|uniref:Fatty acid desaturase n=1 Tax=Sphingomonas ginsenosidivorax TaxID=862135 RepID=A0A5C6UCW9_9SPHN|nr:fatty acid desaturase [Sphingomonas ginsenosidivorax]TXC70549.1 fatty acid desaturase [Sphingomonas ginsenosidivorax]